MPVRFLIESSIGHYFFKLIYSGISLLIVRILVFWYQTQQLCIKWGGWFNFTFFTISSGVRQGCILSPKIFALYMNGLTDELSNSYAGCYINDKCINHIINADDICFMASTGIAMQNLLDVCHNYGVVNDILFNFFKFVYIVINRKIINYFFLL